MVTNRLVRRVIAVTAAFLFGMAEAKRIRMVANGLAVWSEKELPSADN